ncbi:hypothetical protein TNCV_2380461 [Trichonephila clavipes]|nr:hypothetical protein TNCV_2380461 [Trichonephila clavipes]
MVKRDTRDRKETALFEIEFETKRLEGESDLEGERVRLAQLEKQLEVENIKSDSLSKSKEKVNAKCDLNSTNNLEYFVKSVKKTLYRYRRDPNLIIFTFNLSKGPFR